MMSAEPAIPINEIIEEVRVFLPRLLEACDSVAELLYQPITTSTWEVFGDLVQGFDDLYRTMNSVNHRLHNEGNPQLIQQPILEFMNAMDDKFAELNGYMDAEEFTEAGDCLRYELIPVISNLTMALGDEERLRNERFHTNSIYLKSRFPKAYAQVSAIVRGSSPYQIVASKDGSPNLYWLRDYGKPTYLYSRYAPEMEAERWIAAIHDSLHGKSNVMIYGFGFGCHLSALLRTNSNVNIYLYEPDPYILLAAMEVVNLAEILAGESIKDLVVGKDKDQRDGLFYRMLKYNKGETATISLPAYDKLNSEWKQEFLRDAKNAIMNYATSENVYKKYGHEWTRNTLYNMAYNITTPNINGMKGKMLGRTAVIVGAGPSLEADVELLRELKHHAIVIAAGSSIQALQHFGIQPHLIVSMDGGVANYNVFRQVEITDIPILYVPQVEYRVIDNTSKHLFHVYFSTDVATMYLVGLQENDPVFKSSHSVTGTAIQAAAFLGCSEVLFTGQDLSYPDDKVYATGAKHVGENHTDYIMKRAVLEVENVRGGMNRTTESMRLTLVDIEEIIALFPDVRFINTSKKGAKIKGTGWESMEDVVVRLANDRIEEDAIKNAMSAHLVPYPDARIQAMIDRVHSLPMQLNEFEFKLKRVSRNMDKLLELARKNPDKCINKMVEIEQDWEQAVTSFMFNTFFIVLLKQEVSRFDRELPDVAREKNLIKKATLFEDVLGTLVSQIDEKIPLVREMIEEAVRRVSAKLNEGERQHV